jgi:hypothetical protein
MSCRGQAGGSIYIRDDGKRVYFPNDVVGGLKSNDGNSSNRSADNRRERHLIKSPFGGRGGRGGSSGARAGRTPSIKLYVVCKCYLYEFMVCI